MKTQGILWVVLAALALSSCKKDVTDFKETIMSADAAQMEQISDSMFTQGRQFIRTADLRMKVNKVNDATRSIEKLVRESGGFVMKSELDSNVLRESQTPISSDSLLVSKEISISNNMVVKIPNSKLDEQLQNFENLGIYVDRRNLTADDVQLKLMGNELKSHRNNDAAAKIDSKLDNPKDKLNDKVIVAQVVQQKEEASDVVFIDMLSLKEQVAFSTVTLHLYQDDILVRQRTFNPGTFEVKEPFYLRIGDALKFSWHLIEDVVVLCIRFWFILVLGVLIYRWNSRRNRKELA